MGNLFNMDNKFFQFMGRVADLMILNILFIVCSIPVFTIGASTTALFYVTLKMAKNEEAYIVRPFFKSFKQNFRQATGIWLIVLFSFILLFSDFYIISQMSGTVAMVVRYGLIFVALVFSFIYLYVFPVLAKFDNTIKNTIKNSLLMAIRHLPRTIAMLAISIVPMLLTLLVSEFMVYGSLAWVLVGFASTAFVNSLFFVKIFDRYIPDEDAEGEGADSDSTEEKDTYQEALEAGEVPGVTPIWGRETPSEDKAEETSGSEEDTEQ